MSGPAVRISPLDPRSAAAAGLLARSDAHMNALYPPEDNYLESADALSGPEVTFLGVYVGDALAGCGAVKRMHDDGVYGEVKRVFVDADFRGRGLSRRLMAALEQALVEQDVHLARLETGTLQPEALALYADLGYVERGAYGAYPESEVSVFMEKRLPPAP